MVQLQFHFPANLPSLVFSGSQNIVINFASVIILLLAFFSNLLFSFHFFLHTLNCCLPKTTKNKQTTVSSPRDGSTRSGGGGPARGRGRGSRMNSPHIDHDLELGTIP